MDHKKIKLLYLVSHPIQYQAPLLRHLNQEETIDLQVLFRQDLSAGAYDKGFGCEVKWDTPLLEGYSYQYVTTEKQNNNSKTLALIRRLLESSYDVIWLHGYSKPSDLLAIIISKLKGAKVLVRGESVNQFAHGSSLKRFVRPLFFKLLNCFVDGYLAIGTENRNFYKKKGVSNRKIFAAPYTVDNQFFQQAAERCKEKRADLRASLDLAKGRPVILYASKMQQRKHAGDLLEAYIRLSSKESLITPPYLLFIGDGEMRPTLEARAAEAGLDSVRFLGFKNQSELPAYFDLCDVFVLPSVRENWGLIVNEVMNAGAVVIVSDQVGCAVDLVDSGVNGIIYPARKLDALTDALYQVLSDSDRLKKMGEKSLQRISQWGIPETATGIVEAVKRVS